MCESCYRATIQSVGSTEAPPPVPALQKQESRKHGEWCMTGKCKLCLWICYSGCRLYNDSSRRKSRNFRRADVLLLCVEFQPL